VTAGFFALAFAAALNPKLLALDLLRVPPETRKILLVSNYLCNVKAGAREQTFAADSYPGVTEGSRP
jgi:hypothetical protein